MDQKKNILSKNMFWKLENGVLEIFGKGEMPDYLGDTATPWMDQASCITSVWIQEGVTSIGANTFRGCTNLEEVYLAESVSYIGSSAFEGCSALEYIDLTEYAHIYHVYDQEAVDGREGDLINRSLHRDYKILAGRRAFQGTRWALSEYGKFWVRKGVLLEYFGSETSVTIPEEVHTIGMMAMAGCGLQSVTLPDGLQEIKPFAFQNNALTEVILPPGLKKVGRSAFAENSDLAHVLFEADQVELEAEIFRGCSSKLCLEGGAWQSAQRYGRKYKIRFRNYRPKEQFEQFSPERLTACQEAPDSWIMSRIRCKNVLLRVDINEETGRIDAVESFSWISRKIEEKDAAEGSDRDSGKAEDKDTAEKTGKTDAAERSDKDKRKTEIKCGLLYTVNPCRTKTGNLRSLKSAVRMFEYMEEMQEFIGREVSFGIEVKETGESIHRYEWYFSHDVKYAGGFLECELAESWLEEHPKYHAEECLD